MTKRHLKVKWDEAKSMASDLIKVSSTPPTLNMLNYDVIRNQEYYLWLPQGISAGPLLHVHHNIVDLRPQHFSRVIHGYLEPVQPEMALYGNVLHR